MCVHTCESEWMCLDSASVSDWPPFPQLRTEYSTKRFWVHFLHVSCQNSLHSSKPLRSSSRRPSLTHKKGCPSCRLLQVAIWAIHDHRIMTNYLIITSGSAPTRQNRMPQQRLPKDSCALSCPWWRRWWPAHPSVEEAPSKCSYVEFHPHKVKFNQCLRSHTKLTQDFYKLKYRAKPKEKESLRGSI